MVICQRFQRARTVLVYEKGHVVEDGTELDQLGWTGPESLD